MTDDAVNFPTPDKMPPIPAELIEHEEADRLKLHSMLAAALPKLRALGVTRIEAHYEGGGDDGQVEGFTVEPKKLSSAVKRDKAPLACFTYKSEKDPASTEKYGGYKARVSLTETTLSEILTDLLHDATTCAYGSWWNDTDWVEGEIWLDVAAGQLGGSHGESGMNFTDWGFQPEKDNAPPERERIIGLNDIEAAIADLSRYEDSLVQSDITDEKMLLAIGYIRRFAGSKAKEILETVEFVPIVNEE